MGKVKNIAVLLSCSVIQDSRAQRTIKALSKEYFVDVFFNVTTANNLVENYFNKNVTLFPIFNSKTNFKKNIISHSFFYLKNRSIITHVKSNNRKYDLIYSHDLLTLFPAVKLKKYFNCVLVYDTHELYIETINQFFPKNTRFIKSFMFNFIVSFMRFVGQRFEKKAIKKTNLLITVNQSCLSYLEKKYIIPKGVVIPNYPELLEQPKGLQLRKKYNIPLSTFIVLYQGVINEGRYLREIIESARYIDDDILIVLIGNGQLRNELLTFVKEKKLSNKILFIDHIDYSELFSYTADANLGVMLNEHINLSKEYAFANKVTEYMASGLPVLLSDSPEYRNLLKNHDVGYLITDYSPKNIAHTINLIAKDKNKLLLKGREGRILHINEFNWEKYEFYFIMLIKNILNDCNN
ncbi:MAG: glycosyltransferase [Marinilabiliales bacterium]